MNDNIFSALFIVVFVIVLIILFRKSVQNEKLFLQKDVATGVIDYKLAQQRKKVTKESINTLVSGVGQLVGIVVKS